MTVSFVSASNPSGLLNYPNEYRPLHYIVYDYETYGVTVNSTGITQLAAVDLDQNFQPFPKGIPLNVVVCPYRDRLIGPIASIKTHFFLQETFDEDGRSFNIHCRAQNALLMSEKNLAYIWYRRLTNFKATCIIGYNNFGFDDKITSNLFYRNFIHPYSWYSSNNNTRMDLYPLTIAYATLYPQALNWFVNEKGVVSFKLEDVAKVNGFIHENAHDALSDVYACVQLLQKLNSDNIQLEHLTTDQKRNLLDINISPRKCFEHLQRFRYQANVQYFIREQGYDVFVYFDSFVGKREYLNAVPVISLNNYTRRDKGKGRELVLVDLLTDPKDLETFVNLTKEELHDYYSLEWKSRKFNSPIVIAEANKFPLFAPWKACFANQALNEAETLAIIKENLSILNKVNLNSLMLNLETALDLRFKSLPPTANMSSRILKEHTSEDHDPVVTDVYSRLPQIWDKKNHFKDFQNLPKFFPDQMLTNEINLVFKNPEIFDGTKGPDVERFNNYLGNIASSEVLDNLFLLYVGDNYPEILTEDQLSKYMVIKQARLEVAKEEFDNQMIDLRRQYLIDKSKFEQQYSIDMLKAISEETQKYYSYLKEMLLDLPKYREELDRIKQADREYEAELRVQGLLPEEDDLSVY